MGEAHILSRKCENLYSGRETGTHKQVKTCFVSVLLLSRQSPRSCVSADFGLLFA